MWHFQLGDRCDFVISCLFAKLPEKYSNNHKNNEKIKLILDETARALSFQWMSVTTRLDDKFQLTHSTHRAGERERHRKKDSCKRKEFWKSHGLENHKRMKIPFPPDGLQRNAFNMLEFIVVCSFYDGYGKLISSERVDNGNDRKCGRNKTKRKKKYEKIS